MLIRLRLAAFTKQLRRARGYGATRSWMLRANGWHS